MTAADSQIMNYLVRMVVPMRREFGRNLDVEHFLHDGAYAREVLQHARSSRDQRLRDYAAHVEKALQHEDDAMTDAGDTTMPADLDAPAAAPPGGAPQADAEEEALRASMLKKYVGGLR